MPAQNVPSPAKIYLLKAMNIVKGNAWALFETIVCQYVFPAFSELEGPISEALDLAGCVQGTETW